MEDKSINQSFYVYLKDGSHIPIEDIQLETRNRVRKLFVDTRRKKNATQEDLFHESGVARSSVARFESGLTNPSLDMLVKLAAAMGKELDIKLVDIKKRREL